mgnify:CR=1 FL=1
MSNDLIYQQQKLNHQVDVMAFKREQALKDLISVGISSLFEEVLKLNNHIKWLNSLDEKLTLYQEVIDVQKQSPKELTLEKLKTFSKAFPKYVKSSQEKLNEFRLLVTEQSTYKKVLSSIDSSRENLKKHFQIHLEQTPHNQRTECPLCGALKESKEKLWLDYDEQTEKFEALLGGSEIRLKNLQSDLLENYVTKVINKAEYFHKKYKQYQGLVNVLSERLITEDRWQKMQRVKQWLDENNVAYQELINQAIVQEKESLTIQNLTLLKARIRALSVPVESELSYSDLNASLSFYELTYSDQKLRSSEEVIINNTDIQHDIDYVSYIEYRLKSSELKSLADAIKKATNQMAALIVKQQEINKIISIYKQQIKLYEKSVAKQIAIPFYIYSSKILQTRPDGNGIFLQTAESTQENSYIRFTSDLYRDHDAWNTMSSGQISGLVISFMLAMNKVYPTNLSTLLIDDPVQTMDEINMASFVQLLRYEFPEAQIVLSTHERKVANYLSYRYFNSGLEIENINMKNIRLNS